MYTVRGRNSGIFVGGAVCTSAHHLGWSWSWIPPAIGALGSARRHSGGQKVREAVLALARIPEPCARRCATVTESSEWPSQPAVREGAEFNQHAVNRGEACNGGLASGAGGWNFTDIHSSSLTLRPRRFCASFGDMRAVLAQLQLLRTLAAHKVLCSGEANIG